MEQAQIVGHSQGDEVRVKETDGVKSYCIDTASKHVLWTDGDEVEVVRL